MGMLLFMFFIVALQLFVSKGSEWGWGSTKSLILAGISIVFLILFIIFELKKKESPFIDFSLFRNKTFTGATVSNLILNSTSGVLIVTLMLMQQGGESVRIPALHRAAEL